MDLNGRVAIRAKDEEQTRATELVLNRSESVGPAVRFVSNRQYLARAVKLGFSEFHVASPDVPIVCRERQRIFVWMPLSKEGIIPPSNDVVRIRSQEDEQPQSSSPVQRRIKTMPPQQPNGHSANHTSDVNNAPSERGLSIADLLNEAEEMRTVLLDASARLSRLINGLKQHRRQSKAMQAAMHSLRQLRLDG
jgi:hypothetical protein